MLPSEPAMLILPPVCQTEASFDLSRVAPTIESTPDNVSALNKRFTRSVLAMELYAIAHDYGIGAVLEAIMSKMLNSLYWLQVSRDEVWVIKLLLTESIA
jgi:hypothetical protein